MTEEHPFPDREHAAERYLLGEMSDADRDRYEQHFFSCAECAENVRTTAAFLDDVKSYVGPDAAARPQRFDVVAGEAQDLVDGLQRVAMFAGAKL